MRRYVAYLLLVPLLVACGTKSGRFRIEGHLKNMNQAEFYIYNSDDGNPRLDTIRVADGRFIYETDLDKLATFVLLYPNSSEQVIFGESGATVEMEGDASNLKEMEVTGTELNDIMTSWRKNANRLTPPEVKQSAIDFIKENPSSVVSNYLLNRYLLLAETPDYEKAEEMARLMLKAQPENGRLLRLSKQLSGLKTYQVGKKVPNFSATDINGRRVSLESLRSELNIINTWAMWNYDSQSMQRKLHALKRNYGNRLSIVSICVEASPKICRPFLERDSITWSNICDGQLWDSPVLQQLGFSNVPANLLFDRQGKIVAVDVKANDLEEKVNSILK